MNKTVLRSLKNNDNEKDAYNYEIKRMQHLDRIKVQYGKDKFYNPEMAATLPSLDTAFASCSLIAGNNIRHLSSQTP